MNETNMMRRRRQIIDKCVDGIITISFFFNLFFNELHLISLVLHEPYYLDLNFPLFFFLFRDRNSFECRNCFKKPSLEFFWLFRDWNYFGYRIIGIKIVLNSFRDRNFFQYFRIGIILVIELFEIVIPKIGPPRAYQKPLDAMSMMQYRFLR